MCDRSVCIKHCCNNVIVYKKKKKKLISIRHSCVGTQDIVTVLYLYVIFYLNHNYIVLGKLHKTQEAYYFQISLY